MGDVEVLARYLQPPLPAWWLKVRQPRHPEGRPQRRRGEMPAFDPGSAIDRVFAHPALAFAFAESRV